MQIKSMYKSIAIFVFILIAFSTTIIYLSSNMINETLDNSDKHRVLNTIESIAPMVKTSIDFSLDSFLQKNLDEIVSKNENILKIVIKDSTGSIITQSTLYADITGKSIVSTSFPLGVGKIGLIEAYPSNLEKSKSVEVYQGLLFNLVISVPFLILIALFFYSSIIALHNKEKEKAYEELKEQMEEEIKSHQKKTNMLFHQSRLASMGEMISNIAHQWRQPLNTISLVLQNLKLGYALNNLDKQKFDNSMEQIDGSLKYMSETITTFRNYYKTNQEAETFSSKEVIDEAVSVVGNSLEDLGIKTIIDTQINEQIHGYKNELTQVIVNILGNAKEIFEKRNTANPKIIIKTSKPEDEKLLISIEDNGAGISEDIINQIFDPYFTTKHKDQGTGLGLYMSKIIIKDKFKGELKAINIDNGVRFDIELNIHKGN